ncbi:MAG: type I-C CRISPR-associated protein Cas8c/Csd1 [Gallionella sp.]|nr:type I-C CRISPR-associated protein Cas8c/Csd1 [Gallionella sp.]MDD4959092.1 type I-C CRISPR-associated protein Cas8c/Csd1 [Gallionella sp.]
MILQELAHYYQRIAESGDGAIAPEGWVRRPIDYIIVLASGGDCISIQDNGQMEGKRRVAREELVPAIGKQALKHTNSGKDPNLLWDNAAFIFGLGNKGALKASSFDAEIQKWFNDIEDPALTDLKIFLRSMREKGAAKALIDRFRLTEEFEIRDPVLAFQWQPDGAMPIHHRQAIRAEYTRKCALENGGVTGNCLMTGVINAPIAMNETVIKGVWGAQTAGANIVSFNYRSFESYGKNERGGENSPISKQASFAYTTGLNKLLSYNSKQRLKVGDATVVFWSAEETLFESAFADFLDDVPKNVDNPARHTDAVKSLFNAPQHGAYLEDKSDIKFFVLGLAAPAKARLAVRFWQPSTVGEMAGCIRKYFLDIAIVHADYEAQYPTLYRLLLSIAPQGEAKNIPPNLAGETMRAILAGLPYPQMLLQAVIRRIRAEQAKKDDRTGKPVLNVSYPRAALIKAYINRITGKEELKVSLDENNINCAYRLGRLFATLERIQMRANPSINTTIRERFYGAASGTPVTVFPTLLKLKNHHIAKLSKGEAVNQEKLITAIMDGVNEFPAQLNLQDQGRFAIGYYHQRQVFFKPKNIGQGEQP